MSRHQRYSRSCLVIPLLIVALCACEQEGPAERAGKKIDQAIEDARERGDELREEIGERARLAEERFEKAVEELEAQMEEAGRRLDDAANELRKEWEAARRERE